MNQTEKVARWLMDRDMRQFRGLTGSAAYDDEAAAILSLIDQQGEPVGIRETGPRGDFRFYPYSPGILRSCAEHGTKAEPLYLHPPASREREALARKLALDVRRVGTNVGRCCRKLEPYDFELAVKTSRFWEQVEAQTDAILSESREREALKCPDCGNTIRHKFDCPTGEPGTFILSEGGENDGPWREMV